MTDEGCEGTRPAKPPRPGVYRRGSVEFGRAFTFFDATFAVALTLLVTGLGRASSRSTWNNLHSLISADGGQLGAFALSFAVVAGYWLANHRFGASLAAISPRLIVGTLVLLAAVVILPFSTEALGAFRQPLSTAVYAVNVALVTATEAVLFMLAWSEGLLEEALARRTALINLVPQVVPAAVFLASVPIAYFLSPSAARLSWASLFLLSPVAGAWAKRAAGDEQVPVLSDHQQP